MLHGMKMIWNWSILHSAKSDMVTKRFQLAHPDFKYKLATVK